MKRKLICILVANLFAVAPAFAQSDDFKLWGSVGIGGITSDESDVQDASKLNEYKDLSGGLLTEIDVKGRSSRYWLDLFGENLGRDDQYINLRGGMYDIFKYRLYTDALKHNFLFQGTTPYSGFGSAAHVANPVFPRLNGSTWNGVDLGYKRRDDGLMFELQSATPWYVRADANQITWSGSKPGSASQGTSPGNGYVDLGFPVEYTTRNATLEGGFNSKTMHFDLSYMWSKFENDNESLTWTNGYFGNGIDRTYLAADNKYQRIMGNATFRQLPWATTVALRFTDDKLTSDVPLGLSVLNSTAGASAATGPNTDSFSGEVKNQTFSATANSAPMKGLDTRVYYNYRKRDDNSTHVSFNSTAIPGPFDNEPFSYKQNNAGFDVFYRFDRANRIGGGYDWLDITREGRPDYDDTTDQRFWLEWKNSSLDALAARLKYQRLDRDSNFLLGDSGTSSTDINYLNRFVSAFDLSNVTQDMWKLTLDWSAAPGLDIGFEGIYKDNKYDDNTLGRQKDKRHEVYGNVSYMFAEGLRFTLFGDYEETTYDSQHRISPSSGTVPPGTYDPNSPATATAYNWTGQIKDKNWAAGAAVDWAVNSKLVIKASAIYYKTDGFVDLALQEGTPTSVVRPVPLSLWDDSKHTSLNIKAIYSFSKTLSFTGGYAYEKYEYQDAQYDGYRYTVPAATRQDSYLDGVYSNQQYKTNIFYGMVTYRF